MFIVRWLSSHPIIFVWVFAVVALLMGYSMDKGGDSTDSEHIATVEQAIIAEQAASGVEHVATAEQDAAMAEQAATTEQAAVVEPVVAAETVVAESPVHENEVPAEEASKVGFFAKLFGSDKAEVASDDAVEPKVEADVTTAVEPIVAAIEPVVAVEPIAAIAPVPAVETVVVAEPVATAETPVYESDEEKRVAEASTDEILQDGFFAKLFGKNKAQENEVAGSAVVETEVTAETVAANVMAESSSVVVAAEGAQEAVAVEANTLAPAANVDLLRLAREAYWANDYNASINHYQQLITEQPDVLDHKGELANVYWKQGSPKKAAELYADIAIPLVNLGKMDQVKQMNDFIGQFLPERAREIAAKLHP